jgi:hypothetical protein
MTSHLSIVQGNIQNVQGNDLVVTGNGRKVRGDRCRVMGNNCEIDGNDANVSGNNNLVRGNRCRVMGNNCEIDGNIANVSGNNNLVRGNNCEINGNHCRVTGNRNKINGNYCTATEIGNGQGITFAFNAMSTQSVPREMFVYMPFQNVPSEPPTQKHWSELLDTKHDSKPPEGSVYRDDELCVICQENLKRTIVEPCGHACMCVACSQSLSSQRALVCPLCKVDITCIKHFF